ncbi:hypothetical protein VIGAN_08136000 [Vigna angularis var. angularis]|uniref:Uncharacterized protein n=1 Tax=Vigna angularis var. angularis TaxID=157739 RepID=A0A0S3SPF1_PHAAN|nr:hypothetical protein VIGAN_08136000 [Vigna angularis var. angularis]
MILSHLNSLLTLEDYQTPPTHAHILTPILFQRTRPSQPQIHNFESSSCIPVTDNHMLTIIRCATLIFILPYSPIYLKEHFLHDNCNQQKITLEEPVSGLLYILTKP